MKFFLDRSIQGNRFIEFETSVKALGQHVGDLIAVTYVKEGLFSQPFRISKIQPGRNYRTVRVTAQIHDDAWHNDTNGQLTLIPATRPQSKASTGTPGYLYGDEYDEFGDPIFHIEEYVTSGSDGTILTEIEVGFTPPEAGRSFTASVPIVDLQPTVSTSGGTLAGGETLYYAVTAVDAEGSESNPSFIVRAVTAAGGSTNSVELSGLSFSAGTVSFNVYRGDLPTRLRRIALQQALATSFVDTGLAEDVSGAPDPRYDHANFYWRGDGNIVIGGLGFAILEDTQTITAGRFTVHHRDELNGPSQLLLSAAVDETATGLALNQVGSALPGDRVQLDREIVLVEDVQSGGTVYVVTRGVCNSFAVAHTVGAQVYRLARRTETVAFPRGIFGTPAAAEWSHTAWLPGLRIACVEAIVSNSLGDSPVATANYSELLDQGLRTLHGGQFSLQYEGRLAILTDATANITVQESLAIHDCFANLKLAPLGADVVIEVVQDAVTVATLTIPAGQTMSGVLSGASLPVLQESSQLRLNITGGGTDFPGSDLSVTLRV